METIKGNQETIKVNKKKAMDTLKSYQKRVKRYKILLREPEKHSDIMLAIYEEKHYIYDSFVHEPKFILNIYD